MNCIRKSIACVVAPLVLVLSVASADGPLSDRKKDDDGWITLFNGKDLTGWKISDNGKWKVEDGCIVANGARSHLFTEKSFKNFEFKTEVKTTPGSNSGIYFHTKFQQTGWPKHGYESQVNVSHGDKAKTGSLYNTVKLHKTTAKDNEWWEHHIIVKGKRVIVKINGKQVLDYTEPDDKEGTVKLSEGSFAFQAHDPKSVVYFRNIRVKPLPNDAKR